MGISSLRLFLQSLCCNSPWNYAVFWKLKHYHEMILVWEDGFLDTLKPKNSMMGSVEANKILSTFSSSLYAETPTECSVGLAVTEMSSASHVVGKGVVGEVAYTGKARWIYSGCIATDLLDSVLVSEYPDEWLPQFAAGIKTVLLLPVGGRGVLQLGSMEMVAEDASLVAYLKDKFYAHMESDGYDWRYSTQQVSLVSSFMDNYEDPSTITTEQLNKDHKVIHMMPAFTVQDMCNTSISGVTNTFENANDNEISQQLLGLFNEAEPSYEDNKSVVNERIRAFPHFNNFTWGMYEDFVNELMDIRSEDCTTQPSFVDDDFDNAISEYENNSFNFPRECELHKALGPSLEGNSYQYTYDSSILSHNIDHNLVHNSEPSYHMDISGKEVDIEHLLEAVLANEHCSSDDNSSKKSNITSCNTSSGNLLASSKTPIESKPRASVEKDTVSWSFLTSAFIDEKKSISSVESKMSVLADKPQRKLSRMSNTNKRKVRGEDNQKPRPRDRQLIQDRMKELRELVPNSEKSSIDGLLDKTIKHMLFLRGVTNQADKLRRQIPKEEADEKTTKTTEVNHSHQNGTSWAVELGNEQQLCPIVVKDLDQPGHMLIEMQCTDHGRFLEIADVIHRLELTILKGVMEKNSDDSWASFIVETSGSFHRLDIFWPLMQLLQQSRSPLSSKI